MSIRDLRGHLLSIQQIGGLELFANHQGNETMSNKLSAQSNSFQPMVYQIRIKGHLDSQWSDWFEGLTITLEDNGETQLAGFVADQAGFLQNECASQLLKFFNMDPGIGFYLEMVIAPQEIVMALWLIIKGFNRSAIAALSVKTE